MTNPLSKSVILIFSDYLVFVSIGMSYIVIYVLLRSDPVSKSVIFIFSIFPSIYVLSISKG